MAWERKNCNGRGTTFGEAIGRVRRGHKSGLKGMHGIGLHTDTGEQLRGSLEIIFVTGILDNPEKLKAGPKKNKVT